MGFHSSWTPSVFSKEGLQMMARLSDIARLYRMGILSSDHLLHWGFERRHGGS